MSGSIWYGQAADSRIRERATSGGLVTSLLQYALRSGIVDAVCAVKKGADIFDPIQVIVKDPEDVASCAGSMFCGTFLVTEWVLRAFSENSGIKIAVAVKGCDAKAILELIKRNKIDRNDILLIGLNCSGTFPPVNTRQFIREICHEDPDTLKVLSIRNGRFSLDFDEKEVEYSLDQIEEAGYGRRDCCRRCDTPIPHQCDLACGTWGVIGDDASNLTLVEECTSKGEKLLRMAEASGIIHLIPANQKGIDSRIRIENAMLTLSDKYKKVEFSRIGTGLSALNWIIDETSRCIKCYQCTQACPLCLCDDCQTKKPWLVRPGQIPPPLMFHLVRFSHVADSCVNCGQCQDRCAMDIPITLMMHYLQNELEQTFGYHPGDIEGMPVVAKVNQFEEWEHYYGNTYDEISKLFNQNTFN
jgi:formate dehydrogenase (coenzyme F420) beta subunit